MHISKHSSCHGARSAHKHTHVRLLGPCFKTGLRFSHHLSSSSSLSLSSHMSLSPIISLFTHVTSKIGLAHATVVTNDELCNFFFGHVCRNERTERVWTTHSSPPLPTHPPSPPTHTPTTHRSDKPQTIHTQTPHRNHPPTTQTHHHHKSTQHNDLKVPLQIRTLILWVPLLPW